MDNDDLPTVHTDVNSVKEALAARVAALQALIPELQEVSQHYDQLRDRRLRLEVDIQEYRLFLEDALMEDGEWHDQLAHDFSIEKYGHNKRQSKEPVHGQMYIECACEVQCPLCKRYNITVNYWRQRYGERAIYRSELEDGSTIEGYMVCADCAEPMVRKKPSRKVGKR